MQTILGNTEFKRFSDLIYQLSGIKLGEGKRQLLATRLGKRLRACQIDDFSAYCDFINSQQGQQELVHMIDVVSTNKTSFFRESAHFRFLQSRVLPQLKSPRLRIWSAACSSGEEPYSIAMTLSQALPDWQQWDLKLLATDISTQILDKARMGIYTQVEGIPAALLRTCFLKGQGHWKGHYLVRDELKEPIRFRYLNLMGPFPFQSRFDVIFCRNVMIYFDKTTQARLVARLAECLHLGGLPLCRS